MENPKKRNRIELHNKWDKMRKILFVIAILFLVVGCGSCDNRKGITRTDTVTSGFAVLTSDECFQNITQETIDVFEALNSEASILPFYISEQEALELILTDSIRLAIVARDFTDKEKEGLKAKNKELVPRSQRIAIDGIALITHKDNPDSLINVSDLEKVMIGEFTTWKELYPNSRLGDLKVVFDSPRSSTVRFVRDSVCGGKTISKDIYAAENNLEVINYVSRTPGALGVIGANWISNPNDSTQLSFNNRVRVMWVSKESPATPANSYQPVPAHLFLRNYPLTRDVYLLLTDLRGGLLSGFTHFMATERGQRIILKSGLVPANRPDRTILIKEEF